METETIAATPAQPVHAADVALVQRLEAVPTILQLVCDTTGLRFAAVARVTKTHWTACAVRDGLGFNLTPGGELAIENTFCTDVHASRNAIVIDQASQDPRFHNHPIPQMYGFESYLSLPIILRDGSFFGTLCALDTRPARLVGMPLLATLEMFAALVAAQLDLEQRVLASEAALLDAEAAGALREQFIAVLGHDLRNPIAAMAAGLDLLERRPQDARIPGVVGQMKRSCQRMAGLVNDILDFARGRLGGGLAVAPSQPVACDPQRIGQLASNLLANALVHGAPDRPVRLRASSAGGGLVLEVANEGAPIPPEMMPRLFQPFSRGAAGGPRAGLGLGLYIAAEVARAHGGTLDACSDAGGTVFRLEVPAPRPA